MKRVFAVVRTRGPAWEDAKPIEAQAEWAAHAAFMDALYDEGVAVLVGPLENTRDALLIVRASSADEVHARLASDPWTTNGLLTTAQVSAWRLRLGSLDRPDREGAKDADAAALRASVLAINDRWRSRRYDEIGDLLAQAVVLAPPGFGTRVRGRGAYVQSYRDYDAAARTLEFSAGEPQIDLAGDTAVAVCPFDVTYELDGTRYHDRGHDILVFSRMGGEWKVVWRSMQAAPVEQ